MGARRTTRSEPCVGDGEGIAEEELGWDCASFLWCSVLVILLDASSLLLFRRRLRGGSHGSRTDGYDFFLWLEPKWCRRHQERGKRGSTRPSSTFSARASARQGRVPELPAADGTAVQHQRTQDGAANRQDLRALKARLRLEATRRPHTRTARPRNHCASVPSLSAAPRPRAPPWTRAPRARRLRVRTARSASPPW